MKKITIGISRLDYHYYYGVLWKVFFEKLGCKVIVSPETNNNILYNNYSLLEKIYLGHFYYLIDICDYILIPTIGDIIYEKIRNIVPRRRQINYNQYNIIKLTKIGLKFSKNPIKIIYSYIIAKDRQRKYNVTFENEQKNNLTKLGKKILIISPYTILNDKYIIGYTIKNLIKNDIMPIYQLNKQFLKYCPYHSYNNQKKEIIESIYYYKDQIDGIIFIDIDNEENTKSIISYLKEHNVKIPILTLAIEKLTKEIYVETMIESYLETNCKYYV